MKAPKGIFWRWIAELSTYNYELVWCPGKEMGCADALSRSPHMDPPTQEEEDEDEEFIGHIQDGQIDMEEI